MSQLTRHESAASGIWDLAFREVRFHLDLLADDLVSAFNSFQVSAFFRRIPSPPFFILDPTGPAQVATLQILKALGDFLDRLGTIPTAVITQVALQSFPYPDDNQVMTLRNAVRMQVELLSTAALELTNEGGGTVGTLISLADRVKGLVSTWKFLSNPNLGSFMRKILGLGTPFILRLASILRIMWRFSVAGMFTLLMLELARQVAGARGRAIRDQYCLPQDSLRKRVRLPVGARRRENARPGPDLAQSDTQ